MLEESDRNVFGEKEYEKAWFGLATGGSCALKGKEIVGFAQADGRRLRVERAARRACEEDIVNR